MLLYGCPRRSPSSASPGTTPPDPRWPPVAAAMCASNVKRQSRGVMLGQADARDGDLGEDVRRGDGAVGVGCGAGLELGRAERPAERLGGLPDGHVDEGRAASGAAVQLGGNEAGLLLHECSVVGPYLEEVLGVGGRQGELVDEHDRAVVLV